MGFQKGGYKLIKDIRDRLSNEDDVFTQYILPMIRHGETKFQILNTDSAYGFVVVMKVSRLISPFVDDNEEPVNEFVIKICEVNTPASIRNTTLRKTGVLFKKSLSYDMFLREGETQQKIWGERLESGLKPICPAFTNLKIIHDSGLVLELVNTLFQSNGEIVNYLSSEITTYSYDLGFLMMEKIEGDTLKIARGLFNQTARFLCAAAITLYLRHAVINTDMNLGNCIVNGKTGDITMIDFGQVMTPDFLIHCVNSRGDTMKTVDPRETFIAKQVKDNLTEFQKLLLFFEKGRKKYRSIDSKAKVAAILKFLVHMESRFLFMLHGPANSNMTQIVKHALFEDPQYTGILSIYHTLNKSVNPPGTPLKEFVKVGHQYAVERRPQAYFLTGEANLAKANLEYEALWALSKSGNVLPTAEELARANEVLKERLSDDRAFQNAIARGTPGSEEDQYSISTQVDVAAEQLSSTESTEVDDSAVAAEQLSSTESTQVDDSANFEPLSSTESTQVDDSADFELLREDNFELPPDNEDIPVDVLEEVKQRPYEAKRKHEGENGGGKTRRHKKTRRKRRTARHVLRKRKTRKQRKQKTRKIY